MLLVDTPTMGKKPDGTQPDDEVDRNIRVAADLADMLGWISYFEKKKPRPERRTVAQIADPMLRAEVAEMYAPFAAEVTRIAKALGLAARPGQVPKPPGRG